MKPGVPMPIVAVSSDPITGRAIPKSTSTIPCSPRMRFEGLTSRWITFCSCTYASASHAWRAYSTASAGSRPGVPRAAISSARLRPRISAMTR